MNESDLHPPIAWQMLESIKANIIEDRPTASIIGMTPKAHAKADMFEKLLNQQREQDDFEECLSEFAHQGVIRPYSVMKVLWRYDVAPQRERSWRAGELGEGVAEVIEERLKVVGRGASTEVIDAKDFWWNPGATSMRDAKCVYHRTRETRETLEALEEQGLYSNISEIPKAADGAPPVENDDDANLRDIEVIECWEHTTKGVWLSVLADRKVLIRSETSPLKHDELPFVVASISPRPFKFAGRSLAQIVSDLQIAWWKLLNRFIDVVNHVGNPAWRADPEIVDEIDGIYPGKIIAARDGQIEALMTNTSVIAPVLEGLRVIMTILQDLVVSNPYAAGNADPNTVDEKTATEVSLIQSAAQRRLQEMKRQFSYAEKRIGRQQIKLNQQLLSVPEAIRVVGQDGVTFETADPSEFQGRFDYQIEDVAESINRQTKRLEATTKLQTLMGVAPLMPQFGAGQQVNLVAALRDWSEAWGDEPNKFLEQTPMLPMMAPGLPMPPGSGGPLSGAPAAPPPPQNGAGPVAAGSPLVAA